MWKFQGSIKQGATRNSICSRKNFVWDLGAGGGGGGKEGKAVYDVIGLVCVNYKKKHFPSQASVIEHFKIFSRPWENQLAWQSVGLLFCYSFFFLMKIL